jgi:exonuclease III
LWNVQGLNDPKKRKSVRNFILNEKQDVICLQKIKLNVVTNTLLKEIMRNALNSRACIIANENVGV